MPEDDGSLFRKIRDTLLGKPRNIKDPSLFHKLALIPLLAWIGLGADGLSSASYGPEEAFKALGRHTYLALFLALATALTVFVISTPIPGSSSTSPRAAADTSSPLIRSARSSASFPARPCSSIIC